MAKILKPVLRLLERLYSFPGAQAGAPVDIDIGLPIQVVHDVSRMSELGNASIVRASHGYWLASSTQSHSGAGGLTENLNLITPAVASEGWKMVEETHWAWVVDVWGLSSAQSTFTSAQVLIDNVTNDFFIGPSTDQPDSVERLLWRSVSVVTDGTPVKNVLIPLTPPLANFPALVLSPQDGLEFQSKASGAVAITENVLLWVGLRGTFPPGYR